MTQKKLLLFAFAIFVLIGTLGLSGNLTYAKGKESDNRGKGSANRQIETRLTENDDDDDNNDNKGKLNLRNATVESLEIKDQMVRITNGALESFSSAPVTGGLGMLAVNVFGLSFNVQATSGTQIIGPTATTTINDFTIGDKISLTGMWDRATRIITAQTIVNRTLLERNASSVQTRINELLAMLRNLQEELRLLRR